MATVPKLTMHRTNRCSRAAGAASEDNASATASILFARTREFSLYWEIAQWTTWIGYIDHSLATPDPSGRDRLQLTLSPPRFEAQAQRWQVPGSQPPERVLDWSARKVMGAAGTLANPAPT